jgi:hypothetical protein
LLKKGPEKIVGDTRDKFIDMTDKYSNIEEEDSTKLDTLKLIKVKESTLLSNLSLPISDSSNK